MRNLKSASNQKLKVIKYRYIVLLQVWKTRGCHVLQSKESASYIHNWTIVPKSVYQRNVPTKGRDSAIQLFEYALLRGAHYLSFKYSSSQ